MNIDHVLNFHEVEYPETAFDKHIEPPTKAELSAAYEVLEGNRICNSKNCNCMDIKEAMQLNVFAVSCDSRDAMNEIAEVLYQNGFDEQSTFLDYLYETFPFVIVYPDVKEFTNQTGKFVADNAIKIIYLTNDLANTTTNLNSPAEHSANVL